MTPKALKVKLCHYLLARKGIQILTRRAKRMLPITLFTDILGTCPIQDKMHPYYSNNHVPNVIFQNSLKTHISSCPSSNPVKELLLLAKYFSSASSGSDPQISSEGSGVFGLLSVPECSLNSSPDDISGSDSSA